MLIMGCIITIVSQASLRICLVWTPDVPSFLHTVSPGKRFNQVDEQEPSITSSARWYDKQLSSCTPTKLLLRIQAAKKTEIQEFRLTRWHSSCLQSDL